MVNISIITITFNACEALKRTLASIRRHKKQYQTYYVIDGASTDGTLDLIEQNLDIVDHYISEPDLGIYDAMNKVTRFLIKDDSYLIWINSGDELLNWDDEEIAKIANYDCAFFSVRTKLMLQDKGKVIAPFFTKPYGERNFINHLQMWHQGYFIKYSIFKTIGYNINVGIQADRLLMYYTAINCNYYLSTSATANYYLDGISSTQHRKFHQSMLLVAKELGFSKFKLIYYNPIYFLKAYIKPYLPQSLFYLLRKYKNRCI